MELRSFIKQALLDIVEGVKEAQGETESGTVVPGGFHKTIENVECGLSEVQAVDFTITVSIDETKGRKAKLGVFSGIVGGQLKSDVENANAQSTVLKFKIPIQLPTSGVIKPYAQGNQKAEQVDRG
jgi:hypothetical protein